jgi:hypothetical protein
MPRMFFSRLSRQSQRFLLGSLAIVRCFSYPPNRHNENIMLMTINTRAFLPEAAEAASASPCWHRSDDRKSQTGYVLTLAARWSR